MEAMIYTDTDSRIPLQATSYMHCGMCITELPSGVSPKEYARQQLGVTATGELQLWCNRHDCNIALVKITCEEVERHPIVSEGN